jgi:hypothetical protein
MVLPLPNHSFLDAHLTWFRKFHGWHGMQTYIHTDACNATACTAFDLLFNYYIFDLDMCSPFLTEYAKPVHL